MGTCYPICHAVGDNRGCPYCAPEDGTQINGPFQKGWFQLNMGENGVASGAWQQWNKLLEVVSSRSLGGFQQKPDAGLSGVCRRIFAWTRGWRISAITQLCPVES